MRMAELEGELSASRGEQPQRRKSRWRAVTATTLIVIGCLLAPIAVVAVWADDQISDTDRYVETVAPLADDPAVQAAVTDSITEQVFTYVDVEALTKQALAALNQQGVSPQVTGQLDALSAPLANAVEGFVHDRVAVIVGGRVLAEDSIGGLTSGGSLHDRFLQLVGAQDAGGAGLSWLG